MNQHSELRDGMKIEWDVPITMDDGIVLRADVFRWNLSSGKGREAGFPFFAPQFFGSDTQLAQ